MNIGLGTIPWTNIAVSVTHDGGCGFSAMPSSRHAVHSPPVSTVNQKFNGPNKLEVKPLSIHTIFTRESAKGGGARFIIAYCTARGLSATRATLAFSASFSTLSPSALFSVPAHPPRLRAGVGDSHQGGEEVRVVTVEDRDATADKTPLPRVSDQNFECFPCVNFHKNLFF
jgi:hypothetical protein